MKKLFWLFGLIITALITFSVMQYFEIQSLKNECKQTITKKRDDDG